MIAPVLGAGQDITYALVSRTHRRWRFLIVITAGKHLSLTMWLFTALMVAGNVAFSIVAVAMGGLMAVLLPAEARGKAAGWYQVGNTGGGPLLGGISLWFIQHFSLKAAALGIGIVSFLPALPILWVHEPERPLAPSVAVFRAIFSELKHLLGRAETWVGLTFLLVPLGAGAAANLFSAVGSDYHAPANLVLAVTGMPWGVLAMVAGSLVGGAVSHSMTRRNAYMLYGILLGLVAAIMVVAPIVPWAYVLGCLAYQFGIGLMQMAGLALILEVAGTDPMSAGTRFALFSSTRNAPSSLMTWVDGKGADLWGVRGLFAMDGAVGLLGAVLILAVTWAFRRPKTVPVAV